MARFTDSRGFFAAALNRCELAIQGAIVIAEGYVFEPDLALLRPRRDQYRQHARAQDIALVLECGASSFDKDRHIKLPVYAAAGIQEYWIADLQRQVLHVFRQPRGGGYASELLRSGHETITPLACPERNVRAGDIFN